MYAECLKQLGQDLVHKHQGKEPSGRRSNEIALDYDSKFYSNNCPINISFLTMNSVLRYDFILSQKYFWILIDKPYNPLVNSGAISSTALLLNLAGCNDNSSEAMSTTYELVHGCIKVKITINWPRNYEWSN